MLSAKRQMNSQRWVLCDKLAWVRHCRSPARETRSPGEQILAANGFHWAPLGLFGRFPRAVRRALNSQERIDGPAAPSVKCVIFKAFNLRWQFWHTRK